MAKTKKKILEKMQNSKPLQENQGPQISSKAGQKKKSDSKTEEQKSDSKTEEQKADSKTEEQKADSKTEEEFWKKLIKDKLKPIPPQLASGTEGLKKSLRSLRNASLVALFLVNIMWIIVLYLVTFPRLALYGLDPRAFQLLFLAVYGFIIIIQSIAMVCHRGITAVHYFGRDPIEEPAQDESQVGGKFSINS